MNMHRLKTIALVATMSASLLAPLAAQAQAEEAAPPPKPLGKPKIPVSRIISVQETTVKNQVKSQQRIDRIASQTGDLLQDYKTIVKQIDGLRVYNARLANQIQGQIKRIERLDKSISEAAVIQRQVVPLVLRMLDGLEQFVKLDIPFYEEERLSRIERLRANIDRSDLSVAEKFRQVLEAYKIEIEYGRKISSYEGVVEIDGAKRDVNFFQVGRIALVYQTSDQEITGGYNKRTGSFEQLDSGAYRSAVQKGLRISRKQASIDILKVPVAAPEAAK